MTSHSPRAIRQRRYHKPVIDAHVHLWTQDAARYPFRPIDGVAVPEDVRSPIEWDSDTADELVESVLLIQPRVYGYDHTYVYTAAESMAGHARVMPLIDACRPDAATTLGRRAQSSLTAAFRVIALGPVDADWLSSSSAHQLWETGEELDLPVGLLVDPNQLPLVTEVAESHPRLNIVIDHLARCDSRQHAEFMARLCGLVQRPNTYVKLSALGALSHTGFPHDDMWSLVQSVYNAGGAHKLLWGSDWPHNTAYGGYADSRDVIDHALDQATPVELDAIFRTTAAGLFGFYKNTTTAGVTNGGT